MIMQNVYKIYKKIHDFNLNPLLICNQIYKQLTTKQIILWLLPLITFIIPLSTSLTSILMIVFLLLWLLEGNYINKIKLVLNYNYLLIFIIIITFILGTTYSISPLEDLLLYLKKMRKLIFLLLLPPYFKDPKVRRNCINSFIISGLITVISGIYLYRYKVFKNSIDSALITNLTIFFLLHRLIQRINVNQINQHTGDYQSKQHNFNHFINHIIPTTKLACCASVINFIELLFIVICICYLFYININRTGQIIFPCLIATFIIQRIKFLKKKITLLVIICLLSIGSMCSIFINNHFKHIWVASFEQYKNFNYNNPQFISLNHRLIYYYNSLNLIKNNPIIGTGTGSFYLAYKNFVIKNKLFNINHIEYLFPSNPHNEYLLFGVQFGTYGILLLICWFIQLFRISYQIDLRLPERYILQGLMISMIIGCFSNSWLLDFTAGHLFVLFISLCLGTLINDHVIRTDGTIIKFS